MINYKTLLKFSNLSKLENSLLFKFYQRIFLIRKVEEYLAKKKEDGFIDSPVHLSIGQEAIPVAINENLIKGDIVYGTHRSHHHILSLNPDIKTFFCEILCKSNGYSRGVGSSMHLFNQKNKFFGSVPIVAGTIPTAVGSALSQKYLNNKNVTLAYFGDGAVEEGVFFEALNFASIQNLPIVFVIENNFYASHMHILKRQKNFNVSRYGKLFNIKSISYNGNDIAGLYLKSKNLIKHSRISRRPILIECFTYRHKGHVDWREDIDVGLDRNIKILNLWKKNDSIIKLENYLLKNTIYKRKILFIKKKLINNINSAWNSALKSSVYKKDLSKFIYSS